MEDWYQQTTSNDMQLTVDPLFLSNLGGLSLDFFKEILLSNSLMLMHLKRKDRT